MVIFILFYPEKMYPFPLFQFTHKKISLDPSNNQTQPCVWQGKVGSYGVLDSGQVGPTLVTETVKIKRST